MKESRWWVEIEDEWVEIHDSPVIKHSSSVSIVKKEDLKYYRQMFSLKKVPEDYNV